MFPEDFNSPNNKRKEWPLCWWGIVEPSKELLRSIEHPDSRDGPQGREGGNRTAHPPLNNWHGRPHPHLNKGNRGDAQFAAHNSQHNQQPFRHAPHYDQPNQQHYHHHRPPNDHPHHPQWRNNGTGFNNDAARGKSNGKDYRQSGGWHGRPSSSNQKWSSASSNR